MRLLYQRELVAFQQSEGLGTPPTLPKAHPLSCSACLGSGLQPSSTPPLADTINYPHVAIIGAGIGGVALAVACLHRAIPFTLFERDQDFETRSQGYGLTLQQASVAMKGFGINRLEDGVFSTRHVVYTTEGKIVGEWGVRKWLQSGASKNARRTNVHIARQLLRAVLLKQLGGPTKVEWGHQFVGYSEHAGEGVELNFLVAGSLKKIKADLIVGADGIRSSVRKQMIGEEANPLRYLGCIVILGICPLQKLEGLKSELLDSATVFQTANGTERIYVMPFTSDSVMWQLSFPLAEDQAKILSSRGSQMLKKEAMLRAAWHSPIPEIIANTSEAQISSYPIYDRELVNISNFENGGSITLLGDAAHPMSPFKGQGANQALLDALVLARGISNGCKPGSAWRKIGIRKSVLSDFELEMLERSAAKVRGSNEAAKFLHSEIVLFQGNEPRGQCRKRQ